MAPPTQLEKELLTQFRNRLACANLSEKLNTDSFLVRWIRARGNDLDKAEDMLRKHLEWRKENDLDNILTWNPPEKLPSLMPTFLLGHDDDNYPVIYVNVGAWKLREIVDEGLVKDATKFFLSVIERALISADGKTNRQGFPVNEILFLEEADGLSIRTLLNLSVMDMLLQTLKQFEANFPEIIHKCTVINAGRAFSYMFAALRPILSERTVEKLTFYGHDPEKWKPAIETIPDSILPVKYGGTNQLVETKPVEETEEPEEATVGLQQLVVSVSAGDKLKINFTLEVNQTVWWSFRTEKYDISFGVVCSGKAMIENKRVNSHESQQTGNADAPGDYVITFDNSYSRLRTKILYYLIEIVGPSGSMQIAAD